MTTLYRLVLTYIVGKLVIQGPNHSNNIAEYYQLIHTAAKREFSEDSPEQLNNYLLQRFKESK